MCASFQRVELVPVLLPERFRGGCAFGDREFDSLPERNYWALASPNPRQGQVSDSVYHRILVNNGQRG